MKQHIIVEVDTDGDKCGEDCGWKHIKSAYREHCSLFNANAGRCAGCISRAFTLDAEAVRLAQIAVSDCNKCFASQWVSDLQGVKRETIETTDYCLEGCPKHSKYIMARALLAVAEKAEG